MTASSPAALAVDPPVAGQRSVSLCEVCEEPLLNENDDFCSELCRQEWDRQQREASEW